MSSNPISGRAVPVDNRRSQVRRKLDALAYVDLGAGNGGVVVDLSEGGLNCQAVGPVTPGETCNLKFCLPGMRKPIIAVGKVIWSNSSKRGGGLQFLNLDDSVRQQLKTFVLALPADPIEEAPKSETPSAPHPISPSNSTSSVAPSATSEPETPKRPLTLAPPRYPSRPSEATAVSGGTTAPVRAITRLTPNNERRWYSPEPRQNASAPSSTSVAPGSHEAHGESRPRAREYGRHYFPASRHRKSRTPRAKTLGSRLPAANLRVVSFLILAGCAGLVALSMVIWKPSGISVSAGQGNAGDSFQVEVSDLNNRHFTLSNQNDDASVNQPQNQRTEPQGSASPQREESRSVRTLTSGRRLPSSESAQNGTDLQRQTPAATARAPRASPDDAQVTSATPPSPSAVTRREVGSGAPDTPSSSSSKIGDSQDQSRQFGKEPSRLVTQASDAAAGPGAGGSGTILLGLAGYSTSEGFKITSVLQDSPAEGIYLKAGDVISNIDGRPVHDNRDIESAISSNSTGSLTVTCRIHTAILGTVVSNRQIKLR